VIPGLLNFFERHQVGGFQQAAKILLADVVPGAGAGGKALDGLVFHLQALQVQDAKIFLTAFPNLILLQFDFFRHGCCLEGRNIMLFQAAIVNDGREIIWREARQDTVSTK
jgi:hypothetical protein